jgi:hypothetical protein
MTSALSCFFSVASQLTVSAMFIRLVVRVVGIGIGVAIASLVWVSMGSGYNYVSIVVGVCARA